MWTYIFCKSLMSPLKINIISSIRRNLNVASQIAIRLDFRQGQASPRGVRCINLIVASFSSGRVRDDGRVMGHSDGMNADKVPCRWWEGDDSNAEVLDGDIVIGE